MTVAQRMRARVFGAAGALLLIASSSLAQEAAKNVPPPLPHLPGQTQSLSPSAPLSDQSSVPSETSAASRPFVSSVSNPWRAVTAAPAGLCNPLLLTDGSVMVAHCGASQWYKLTPDSSGNYADGTWVQLASLPFVNGTRYAPLYFASAVLPDGRVIIMGGEYLKGKDVDTTDGAIYDPVANKWTPVAAPAGWSEIGDAPSVVLANGTFMLGSCCDAPAVDAVLDPETLTWTSVAAPSAGNSYQNEQGYELLPNNRVLTIDIWTNYATNGNARNAERYNPTANLWTSAGVTPESLSDPAACGNYEIGPAVARGDGTVVAFGAHTGCQKPADPTAIYNVATNHWSAGPFVPAVCGSTGLTHCTLADAPAALLPDGNILFAASAGFAKAPTHFFEFTAANAIQQVSDPLFYAATESSYQYNFLVLPNGQIFVVDQSPTPEVYTPTGAAVSSWAPSITAIATTLTRGTAYKLRGTQLNGVSAGAYYGDDVQAATNYPIVRVTNIATGDVVYARTADHSSMSIAPGTSSFTYVTVPAGAEVGPSSLVVIANGIASAPVAVTIR